MGFALFISAILEIVVLIAILQMNGRIGQTQRTQQMRLMIQMMESSVLTKSSVDYAEAAKALSKDQADVVRNFHGWGE